MLDSLGETELEEKSRLQNNLALVLQALGDFADARNLYEKALKVFQHSLGENHPYIKGVISWIKNLDQLEEGKDEE